MKDKVKIGVIGAGYLGELHIKKLLSMPNAKLIGFYDTSTHRVKYINETYGLKGFESLADLLLYVDAVVISAPTPYHYEITKEALRCNKHVLVEKPMCEEIEHGEELIRLSRDRNLILQVGHVERFNPAISRLIKEAKRPFYFEARREMQPLKRSIGTDVVLDLMIHDLDILFAMNASKPHLMDATGYARIGSLLDFVSCWISFEDGSKAFLLSSRISPNPMRAIRYVSTESCFNVDCKERAFQEVHIGEEELELTTQNTSYQSDPLWDEDQNFLQSIMYGRDPVVSGEDGLKVIKFAHEIKEHIGRACTS